MTPRTILTMSVEPALAFLETVGVKSDERARVLLMAIAGQESAWAARLQVPVAYARSFWQFERGGGVAGVLSHPASSGRIKSVCAWLFIPCSVDVVYDAMAWNDVLAASMARLLLFTDPRALPAVGEIDAAWDYYIRCWRPGAPHRSTWDARYATALAAVRGATA